MEKVFSHVGNPVAGASGLIGMPPAVHAADPTSLKTIPVPLPVNLNVYVADRAAAIRLGKALFWDMQVGSDAMTACASCHFHAGTDSRSRNTVSPGGDGHFALGTGANVDLRMADFPFHAMTNPEERGSGGTDPNDPMVQRSLDDRVGAQGVVRTQFLGTQPGRAIDPGRAIHDAGFNRDGHNVRQSTGRNAPSVINAVFNYANFLDGRANHFFNGVNPFGPQDAGAVIWVNAGGRLAPLDTDLPSTLLNNASLASQAVGPPLSDVEMSWIGRTWPDIGRKMLSLKPLGQQVVHPQDSVLAGLADLDGKGLKTTYQAMIEQAFHADFWNGNGDIDGYTQVETNFSLFFGLSVMLYESTLVSDDSPFDRFLDGNPSALSESAQRGMNTFLSDGAACFNCHVGAELTAASISNATNPLEPGLVETMNMGDGGIATYDIGFYNIGVTPTTADAGRGDNDPFGNPLSFSRQRAIVNGNDTADTVDGNLTFHSSFVPTPGCVPDLLATPALICPPNLSDINRVAIKGAFKTPGLRNVELTGPYMHNGSMVTLMQVVDFYVRGGNFRESNMADLDPFINDIIPLKGAAGRVQQVELVDFLLSLTDERVRWEEAPFDHPQLLVPAGHNRGLTGHPKRARALADNLVEIPPVGRNGRQVEGLPPLKPYLAEDQEGEALENFHFQE